MATQTRSRRIRQTLPSVVRPAAEAGYQLANRLLGTAPRVVIIGTGRSGTGFVAEYLTRAGLRCSHERFFTPEGPKPRNAERSFLARADASFMAVPFLPYNDEVVLHQVRHPHQVIASFHRIGLFDPEFRHLHERFLPFVETYFEASADPLQSCLRWYVEWNERCEQVTDKRYRVEDFSRERAQIAAWVGLDTLPELDVATDTNTKQRVVEDPANDFATELRAFPEYAALTAMAKRYGYDLT